MVTNVSFGQTSLGLTPFQFAFASLLPPSDTRIESCGKRSVLQTRHKDTTKIWNLQIIACANLSRMRFWRPKLTSIICNFARGIIYDFKFQILFVNNYQALSSIIFYNQKRAALSPRLSRSPCESRRWMALLSKLNAPFPATSLVSPKDCPAAYKKHDVCDILQKTVPLRYTSKT